MEVLNTQMAGKQDKIPYETEMKMLRAKIASCNSNVYEVEERMTVIETTSDESIKRINEKIRSLQDQVYSLHNTRIHIDLT